MFGVMLGAIELQEEMVVENGQLTDKAKKTPVQTRSADFAINEDGTMVQAAATSGRRSAEPATVKTMPVVPRHDIEVFDWAGLSQTDGTPMFSFETTCEK